ncbi:8541_t:CDS:2 [Entrophospora sp. SA101]|nr:8541_t:CDS:2 [Entrophospora sp. SA101]
MFYDDDKPESNVSVNTELNNDLGQNNLIHFQSNDDGNDNGNNNNDNGDDDTKESYRVLKSPLSSSDGGGGTLAIWGYSQWNNN